MKEKIIKDGKEIAKKDIDLGKEKKKGVLHNIFIMDASNSMNESSYIDSVRTSKYVIANRGVNDEIEQLKKSDEGDVNITVIEFDSNQAGTERITEHYVNTPLKDVHLIQFRGARGNTPLYQTIHSIINKFLRIASNEDTVLIKIFTDGAHNCFWGVSEKDCRDLIKDVQDNRGFIITFIGTERDTRAVIDNLGMEIGNTFSYDGSASGLYFASGQSMISTNSLISNRREGKQLKSKNFYNQNIDQAINQGGDSIKKTSLDDNKV